jgi:penicillin-binding protein 1A
MGQGAKTARPIWERFMRKVYLDGSLEYRKGTFKRPSSMDITMDCSKYEDAASDSTKVEDPALWDIK